MSSSEPKGLNHRQRDTLLQIFEHPVGHNIEWPAVLSLLEATGSVDRRHDGSTRCASVTRPRSSPFPRARTSTHNRSSTCDEC